MGRSILAVFLGWATALFIIVVVEAAGHRLFPLPAGADIWNEAALRSAGPEIPATALILVVLGWAVGALGGGFLAGRLVQRAQVGHALLVALVVLGVAIWTMVTIPHPAWMWAASVLLVPAGGWLGGRLALKASRTYHGSQEGGQDGRP
jgi:hypothetical protein